MAQLRQGLIALVGTGSAAAACATVWWLGSLWSTGSDGNAVDMIGPAVLAAVVALTLSRQIFTDRNEFLRSVAIIPVIGLVSAGIGWLLLWSPPIGAAFYVVGMSLPIWLRRFGAKASRVGTLMTLPLTAVLIVPVAPRLNGSATHTWVSVVVLLCANIIAVFWCTLGREILVAAKLLPTRPTPASSPVPQRTPQRTSSPKTPRKLIASTRMAIQMAVAVSAAFIVGWILFPGHGMWVVLTAFIVNAGNRGRADVLHKSVLRVAGAVGGTLFLVVATNLRSATGEIVTTGMEAAVVIFTILFIGSWLRTYSYAFWALTVTVVLTILQELDGRVTSITATGFLVERVLAIIVGGIIGVGSAWFVLPVRSIDVIRRRLSDLLTSLTNVITASPHERELMIALFTDSLHRIDEVAPAQRARRVVTFARVRNRTSVLPIDALETAHALGVTLESSLQHASDNSIWPPPEAREKILTAIRHARFSLTEPVEAARIQKGLSGLAAIIGEVR